MDEWMKSETHLHDNDESHLGRDDVPVVHVVCVLFGMSRWEAEITIPARKTSVGLDGMMVGLKKSNIVDHFC